MIAWLLALALTTAPRVQLSLVAADDADGGMTLGLQLQIEEGWHVYWTNPGDSGMATTAAISAPVGWAVGPVQFPGPQAFTSEGLVTYGYTESALLLAQLTPRGPGTITVTARWLVCKEVCEPGSASLTADPRALPRAPAQLAAARTALPSPLLPEDAVDVRWDGDTLEVRVVAEGAELFPSEAFDLATGSARPRFHAEPSTPGEEIVNSSVARVLRVRVRPIDGGAPLQAVLRVVRRGVVRDVLLTLARPDDPAPR